MASDDVNIYEKNVIQQQVLRYDQGDLCDVTDQLAVEEPLEIRVAGETVATTMRTPGEDRALALGFLYSEGLISRFSDVGRAGHCGRPGDPSYGHVVDVLPAPGSRLDPELIRASRRGTLTSSACGVCGREMVVDLAERCKPLKKAPELSPKDVFVAQAQMQEAQTIFSDTGGVHAAAAFSDRGEMLACFEDVGRHNAVDKVVGTLLEKCSDGKGMGAQVLTVSSRASFEIVQKAVVARIPVVVAVSAASSLAVSLAEAMGITLIGFARSDRMVVYAGTLCEE